MHAGACGRTACVVGRRGPVHTALAHMMARLSEDEGEKGEEAETGQIYRIAFSTIASPLLHTPHAGNGLHVRRAAPTFPQR